MMQIEDNTPYEIYADFLTQDGELIEHRLLEATTREDNRGWEVDVDPRLEGDCCKIKFQIVRKD